MSSKRNTCDKCKNYKPADQEHFVIDNFKFAGSCALIGDSNDQKMIVEENGASGWDWEGYKAGVYVGPKFGCIHWEKHV